MGMQPITIGDGTGWTFVNGRWEDAGEGVIAPVKDVARDDGPGMQGHHYAFLNEPACGDLRARFQFSLAPHSDAGLIFRASGADRFLVVHFPDCGQASRAQHFWVAVSEMDEGYLRIRRMEMLRRVSSMERSWHDAEVTVSGDELTVIVDGRARFEVSDLPEGVGLCGFLVFGPAEIKSPIITPDTVVSVTDPPVETPACTWFHPCPDSAKGLWQKPRGLLRTPGGDLLLVFMASTGWDASTARLMTARSSDGRSWSDPQTVGIPGMEDAWQSGFPHVFPDGSLRMVFPGESDLGIAETDDDGRTWRGADSAPLPSPPAGMPRVHPGPLMNLRDGAMLLMGYGRNDTSGEASGIYQWGSTHCQACCSRSDDGGLTWHPWINLDGTTNPEGEHAGGSLDLTEICAAQTADGTVRALIRPIYSPWMWETWSEDGGRSWSSCVRGPFPGYATSNMLRTSSGKLVVAHRLPGCTVHVSHDDGLSWDEGTMIDSAIWVMGAMVEIEPDVVLYVYYDSFESLMRAQIMRVDTDGIHAVT
jgi:hypothetical protein